MAQIKLMSTELSPGCGVKAQIVRSRDGGFISRDCLGCGRSHYVNESKLPNLPCEVCRVPMQIKKLDGTNYFYECSNCNGYNKIATLCHCGTKSSVTPD